VNQRPQSRRDFNARDTRFTAQSTDGTTTKLSNLYLDLGSQRSLHAGKNDCFFKLLANILELNMQS
jgi:hypothetical protein